MVFLKSLYSPSNKYLSLLPLDVVLSITSAIRSSFSTKYNMFPILIFLDGYTNTANKRCSLFSSLNKKTYISAPVFSLLPYNLAGNTLVLFHLIDHGKTIHDLILTQKEKDRKLFFVYGGTDAETREQIREIAETENNSIIVASFGTFSTGVNIRNLHNIIFASPSKSKIRNLQSIGRGLRKGDKKEKARLIDISDDLRYKSHVNYTLKHFSERIKIYNEEKFDYKLYKIGMK